MNVFLRKDKTFLTMEHILPDLLRDSSKGLSAFFVSVNSLSTVIENGPVVLFVANALKFNQWQLYLIAFFALLFTFQFAFDLHCFVYISRPSASLQSCNIFLNICSFVKYFLVFVEFPIQKR